VQLNIESLQMANKAKLGMQCQTLSLAIELNGSTKIPEATIRAIVNLLLSDRHEGMRFV